MKNDEQWDCRTLCDIKIEGKNRGGEGRAPVTTACPEAGKSLCVQINKINIDRCQRENIFQGCVRYGTGVLGTMDVEPNLPKCLAPARNYVPVPLYRYRRYRYSCHLPKFALPVLVSY